MNKFRRNIAEIYHTPQESEAALWDEAIFVFDTSSLLYLYEYSDDTKSNILSILKKHLQNRLWIPHHVAYEYLKNRERVILNPITDKDKYKGLTDNHISNISQQINSIINKIGELHKKIKKKDMHPYVDEGIVELFKDQSNEYQLKFNSFSSKVEEEISKRENEINFLLKEDIVLNFIEETFNVGKEYCIDTVFDIVKESNFRFPNKIAPGWEDQDDKEGIQRVSDLIIWKQIIDFSKETNKPIILVINDVKDDWCHSKKRSNEKRITRPRKELIQEIRDKASTNFWMYTFNEFLYKSKGYLETNIKPETLDEVKRLSQVRSYFILNTNLSNSEIDHQSMMDEQIAAAYFGHWKNKIFKIDSGDIVFLYKSGTGITAMGVSDGVVQRRDYQGKSEYKDEEHYVKLDNFCNLECDPIAASEVKEITGTNHRFMTVMFKIDGSEGSRLFNEAEKRRCTEST